MRFKIKPNEACPCMSGKKYKKCCRPYHTGNRAEPMPEDVVRARYAAYALSHIDYLMATTHPESPHYNENTQRWRSALEAYCLRNFFPNLEILSAEGDQVSYRAETVELGTYDRTAIEHCTFKQVDGRWLYFDGDFEEPAPKEDVGASE